jgi:hypothetical protein
MVQAKGSPQQKEQLSAILAKRGASALQKQDYVAAADLSRQCVKTADPKGKVAGSCQLIFGWRPSSPPLPWTPRRKKTKSCDLAKKEDALVAEADTALKHRQGHPTGRVQKPIDALPQFKARTASMIKSTASRGCRGAGGCLTLPPAAKVRGL